MLVIVVARRRVFVASSDHSLFNFVMASIQVIEVRVASRRQTGGILNHFCHRGTLAPVAATDPKQLSQPHRRNDEESENQSGRGTTHKLDCHRLDADCNRIWPIGSLSRPSPRVPSRRPGGPNIPVWLRTPSIPAAIRRAASADYCFSPLKSRGKNSARYRRHTGQLWFPSVAR